MLTTRLNLSKFKPNPPENLACLNSLSAKLSALKEHSRQNQRLDGGCFVVFDTETTGLSARRGDEIISLGAVLVKNNRLTPEYFSKLVNPFRDVPEQITLLTGINDVMVSTAEDFFTVLDEFLGFVGQNPLVAHNSHFDLSFINHKLRRYFNQTLCIPVLDTYLIAQLLHPNRKSYSLDSLAKLYSVSVKERHTSLGDSIITGKILNVMLEELVSRGIKDMVELISYLKFRRLL